MARLVRRRRSHIFGIRLPLAIDNLNGDQARQTLLLTRLAECWELATYGHCWRRNRVLRGYASAQSCLHGLNVKVVSSGVMRLCIVRGRHHACVAAHVPAVPL